MDILELYYESFVEFINLTNQIILDIKDNFGDDIFEECFNDEVIR